MSPTTLEAALAAKYCNPPGQWLVVLHVDDSGTVGGYRVSMRVMDSPIHFYRADGTLVGFFHVFAAPEENARYADAIEDLKRSFPHERAFDCTEHR